MRRCAVGSRRSTGAACAAGATPTRRRGYLEAIPGIGPLIASLLVMKAPDPHLFKSGRDFAAWLGLTPRDHLERPARRGRGGSPAPAIRCCAACSVVGATAVIWRMPPGRGEKPCVRLA